MNAIFGFIAVVVVLALLVIFLFAPLIAGCMIAENPFETHYGFILAQLVWYVFWHFKFTEE